MKKYEDTEFGLLTDNTIDLAIVYYPILLDLGKKKEVITYGGLVARAKSENVNHIKIQKTIPLLVGRILNVLRQFTKKQSLPDLSCLVISKNTGECSGAYTDLFDPAAERRKVAEADWSKAATEFDYFIRAAKNGLSNKIIKSSKKI